MKFWEYLYDKLLLILISISGMLLLVFYLLMLNNSVTTVIIIMVFITGFFSGFLVIDFYRKNQYFKKINHQMENLEKPYLIHELIEKSWHLEDNLYKEILAKSNKSALDAITNLEKEQSEYKDFIEAWIHEVKLPMTSIYLATSELESEKANKISTYLTALENQVDQALFYARSDQVHQDYLIKEESLDVIIRELVKKNKFLLIQNNMQVTIASDAFVRTDSKWLSFILNQVIFNAVKYKKQDSGKIEFSTIVGNNSVQLKIKDNGIGIRSSDLPRVFDKGFTGVNGRNIEKSTGFGLYLTKKLCLKLGLNILIDSKENEFTEITIIFPHNSYLTDL